ncbi:hypothetical protein [Neotabrizicola sp. sgz301269]|uniref:hypothetical protein n=1 Tax=Neotabrizicola sp. sgz301269 TaxID=3276282 RepID=UPI00376F50F3
MTATGYPLVAEDFIAMATEQPGGFDFLLCHRLIDRSKELPTAATSDHLLTDVLSEWVHREWSVFEAYRRRVRNAPVWSILSSSIPSIVEALKPLCSQSFLKLNALLSIDREILFRANDYTRALGQEFYEEAPSITFTRYLNEMERHRKVKSETYEREVPRMAEVHALNRVAKIMPHQFHQGRSGWLKPGQSIEDHMREERQAMWRALGVNSRADLLAEAGQA